MESLHKRERIKEETEDTNTYTNKKEGDFNLFEISPQTQRHLESVGISYLFPIQYKTFNAIYQGYDLIGKDRTGSGKTLAFSLPILEKMRNQKNKLVNAPGQAPFVIVLVPTRELAMQVTGEFQRFKNYENEYRVISIYGKTEMYPQLNALKAGIEILVGTPGRILDLLERKAISFRSLEHFILDETDQMLNIGFEEDIERILKTLRTDLEQNGKSIDMIQFLLFSATIPRWIEQTSKRFMKPSLVFIDMVKNSETKTSKTVQHLSLCFRSKDHKIEAIGDLVLVYGGSHSRTIIFTDTKEEANEVLLKGQLKVECQVLHGDIPQKQREVTFTSFRNGTLKCLVATNVAARGLDIPTVDLIVQLAPPKEIETYIHRSGRTGRAGKEGTCITFFTKRQQELMDRIEQHAKIKFRQIGAPQPQEIMRSNARDISFSFDKVSPEVLVYFKDNVKEILEKYTPDEAICRALAVISGYTKAVQQRSLLSSIEGFVTYQMTIDQEVRSLTYFWGILRKHFSPKITDSISGMRLLTNHRGVVFDVKEEDRQLFEEVSASITSDKMTIETAKELPDIEESNNFQQGGQGNSYGGYNSGYGSGGFTNSNPRFQNNGFQNRRNDQQAPRIFDRFGRNNPDGQDQRGRGGNNGSVPRSGEKDESKLFVGNLPFDFQDSDLNNLCRDRGLRPIDVFLSKNPEGTNKGFGILKFENSVSAKEAMNQLSSYRIGSRSLRVDYADKK
jgi:ATP-dependent RNA helicase DDX21